MKATTKRDLRAAAAFLLLLAAVAVLLASCGDGSLTGPLDPNAPKSVAFNAWSPGPNDTCPLEIHQRYSTKGPDGKLYPTWHPPVDPETGCSFGHEHGRDPHGSDLYGLVGDIPLGYANEQLDTFDPTGRRHEDHFGHKYEWENDVEMRINGGGGVLSVKCDIMYKLHQGTHSKDAFTNNLHEVVYHAKCNDGTEVHMTIMAAIGRAGEFTRTCDGARIQAGTPSPANSPNGGGQRVIPDIVCVERHMLVSDGNNSDIRKALHESWQQSLSLRTAEGRTIAHMDPYFQVFQPSRFYDPAAPNVTGRPVDMCTFVEANGDRARTTTCNPVTAGMGFDDPRSPFDGVRRVLDINSLDVANEDGPTVWYTDPFGRGGRTESFPGSIRQFVSRINNTGFDMSGPGIGSNRNYGGAGVHAPN
ncbi:MAG: hypothetical protein R2909_17325 [Gemmatimonadales bacterium]